LIALVVGCRKPNEFVPPPPPIVTVAHPVERPVSDSIEFVGTTQATQTVDLRARVNGYLEKILFEDGSIVKAGDELFIIEQAPYQVALDAAKAAEQKGTASLALAQSQYRRMEPLLKDSVVTKDEIEVQAAQVESSKADVAAAEAAVRKAELDLGYTKITAPITGRIGRHLVDIGNLVREEQTQLAVIQAIDPIYVYFDVSENDLLRFMAMLRNHELPDPDKNPPVLHLGLADEPGFPHEGHLDFRELNLNTETGTALRRGIFPNPGSQLIPGMFVRLQASIGAPKPRLLIEERAIATDQRGDYLLVVDDKNVVEYRPVQLGIHVDQMRVIESGINLDDWVIVNGLQRARPGAQVTPEQAKPLSDAAAKPDSATPSANPTPAQSATSAESVVQPATNAPVEPQPNAESSDKPK
jgi:RND family efflux transporter MFP subunit